METIASNTWEAKYLAIAVDKMKYYQLQTEIRFRDFFFYSKIKT